jgi:hypothetical protein
MENYDILSWFALFMLTFVSITAVYVVIYIHDIPYNIAKKRNHPHSDAIHTAGWVSLFLLHTIWPFLWIWATLYNPKNGWGIHDHDELKNLKNRIDELENKLSSEKGEK